VSKLADRFVLESELGSGGMARVFLGRDEVLDRPVAVKVLNPVHGGSDIGDRFQREGRTAARLAHPNIVQVYDAGEGKLDGRESPYIVMEYVPGGDLKELIDRRGRLSGAELSRLGAEVCSGLTHAHERGVIHRDIKPHNILLDENGHAKLTDFGIARALDTSQATLTGAYLGTALYSSPEQLQGQKVTPKSDVYSLGATLYQAATGEAPFSGGTPIEVASQHVSKAPTPLRERGADVSEGLEALILACLAKRADDRPTAEEARSRLEAGIPAAGATQAQTEAPAAAPPRNEQTRAEQPKAEQTRSTPAAPPPGGRPAARPSSGDHHGRRRGALAVVALLAVLAVIGALAAPSLLGGSGEQGSAGQEGAAQNNAQQDGASGGTSEEGGGAGDQGSQGDGGGQQAASGDANASANTEPTEGADQGGSGDLSGDGSGDGAAQDQGDPAEQEAARAIEEVYEEIDDEDYEASYKHLSEGFKASEAPTRAIWASTFDQLQSVRFIDGPDAQVSGNTGTVTGVTIAENAGQTERNTVTWRVVNEDGDWKLDAITSFEQEIISG
jgi:eukaryotic-like serine/threonine-protein kinase